MVPYKGHFTSILLDFWLAGVLDYDGNNYLVRYDVHDSSWDEWVTPDRFAQE